MSKKQLNLCRKILSAASSPEGHEHLSNDVREATHRVATIRDNFRTVSALISVTTDRRPYLKPLWNEIEGNYVKIIVNYKDLASGLAAFASQFTQAILKLATNETFPLASKKKIVESNIDKGLKFQDDIRKIFSALDQLSGVVKAFDLLLNDIKSKGEQGVHDKVDTTLRQIDHLYIEIDHIDAEISKLAQAINLAEIGTGIVEGTFPSFIIGILESAASGVSQDIHDKLEKLKFAREAKLREIQVKYEHIKEIQKHLDPIATAHALLHQLSYSHRAGVTESIKAFDDIRKGILRESDEILTWLNSDRPTPENAPLIVLVYNADGESIFTVLAGALRQYVSSAGA